MGSVSSAGSDLFSSAAVDRLGSGAPLAARLRPKSLDEVVGQADLVGQPGTLRLLVEADRLSSLILWGPPGTGKTTLARLVADASDCRFVELSAVNAGVADVRTIIAEAKTRLGGYGQRTILFLDEVHRFNKAQQDGLLPAVESGELVLIGATTENPFFEVNSPLRSRSVMFRLEPLSVVELGELIRRGLKLEGVSAADDAVEHLADKADGDGRQALTTLEVAIALAHGSQTDGAVRVELNHAESAVDLKALKYGVDDHYNIISAYIKSMRGSDPDAALYWLARMLEAGEEPRFIARRLVVAASEEVGLADPTALLVATAAAQAVEFVGLPEARINLAQATVHIAAAPKSNSAYAGLSRAMEAVRNQPLGQVPVHLRDPGQGYDYPHDHESGWVDQQYRPSEVSDQKFYEPVLRGREADIATRLANLRNPQP